MDRPEKFKKNIPSYSLPKINNLKRKTIDEIELLIGKIENLKLDSETIHYRNKKPENKIILKNYHLQDYHF